MRKSSVTVAACATLRWAGGALVLLIGLGMAVPVPVHAVPPTLGVTWRVAPDVISCTGPTDAAGRPWTNPLFDDSVWQARALPDSRQTTSARVSRFYRGRFTLQAAAPIWLFFSSDDGGEIFINGTPVGSFGHGCANDGCNNLATSCGLNQCVPPIAISQDNLVAGTNVVSFHLWNGPSGAAQFNMLVFPANPGECGNCTLDCVPPTPTRAPTNTPPPTATPTRTPTTVPACRGVPVGGSCGDAIFCNGTDTCNAVGNCVHSGDLPATTPCDDGDPCTLHDQCNGAGTCVGVTYTGNYTVLTPTGLALLRRTLHETDVTGKVCADTLLLGEFFLTQGDVVALRSTPTGPPHHPAITFRDENIVDGSCATGGGWVFHPEHLISGGDCDTSGTAPDLAECLAAQCKAAARQTEWANLPVTPGFNLGPLWVKRNVTLRIPALGTLGPGTTVIDTPSLRLDGFGTLVLAGDATTGTVIVRVHGPLRLGRPTTLTLQNPDGEAMPRQILWMVDGKVNMHSFATVAGTVWSTSGRLDIGTGSIIDGAVIGSTGITTGSRVITTSSRVVLSHDGFVGW